MYSQGEVKHDPEQLAGLATMMRPETAGELMQFLQAVDWLRTSLPRIAEVVWPLRVFLEDHMAGATSVALNAWLTGRPRPENGPRS